MNDDQTNEQIVDNMRSHVKHASPRQRMDNAFQYVQYDQFLNVTADGIHDGTYKGALTQKDIVEARATLDVTNIAWGFTDSELAEVAEIVALDELTDILWLLEYDLCLQHKETPGKAVPFTLSQYTMCHLALLYLRNGLSIAEDGKTDSEDS